MAALKREPLAGALSSSLMALPDYYELIGLKHQLAREEAYDRAAAALASKPRGGVGGSHRVAAPRSRRPLSFGRRSKKEIEMNCKTIVSIALGPALLGLLPVMALAQPAPSRAPFPVVEADHRGHSCSDGCGTS